MSSDRLAGKVALITGGARGQGAAHARAMVAEGAQVAIADVLLDEAQALASSLGSAAVAVDLDVTDEDSWSRAMTVVDSAFGPTTVLVNNAGIVRHGQLVSLQREEFETVLAVNLIGPWLGIAAVSPGMIGAGSGSIINVCSNSAVFGFAGVGAYTAAKWGLRGLTKVAAIELGHHGIRVNAIHPGVIKTPMTAPLGLEGRDWSRQPVARAGEPEDITGLVVFLASEESSYITGADHVVDGGMTVGTVAPSLQK